MLVTGDHCFGVFMNKGEKEASKNEFREDKNVLLDKLHHALFPEDMDFMMDSIKDAKERKRGKIPMNIHYQEKVNTRRKSLGVLPLKENGMPADKSSKEYIIKITQDLTYKYIQIKLSNNISLKTD